MAAAAEAGERERKRAAEEQATPKAKAKPRGKQPAKPAAVEYPRLDPETTYSAVDVEFDLMRITFDVLGQQGQARILDSDDVQRRLMNLRTNPPCEPVLVELWESVQGGPFVCLAGQHTASALQLLRREEGREDLPRWLKVVKANIVPPGTDLVTRKLVAGAAQAREQSVVPIQLSRCCELLYEVLSEAPEMGLVDACIQMIARSGCERTKERVCIAHAVLCMLSSYCFVFMVAQFL